MPSQDVCPSVHLSHAGSLLCRKRHSCFSTTNVMGWQYSDWDPLTGASNAGDRMKNRDVRTIALFRKWYKIRPQLPWNAERNSYAVYRMVLFPMTLYVQWQETIARSLCDSHIIIIIIIIIIITTKTLQLCRNVSISVSNERSSAGRLFHARGPWTAKLRSP